MKFLNQKNILITGGTGSFGNAATEYLLKYANVKKLIIFSRDENKQFIMQNKFKSKKIRFFLGDVRDESRLEMALKDVDYVIHAAALKQVPAAEYNPFECIKTNIYGAQALISATLNSARAWLEFPPRAKLYMLRFYIWQGGARFSPRAKFQVWQFYI